MVGGFAIEVQMAAEGKDVPYAPTQDIDITPRQELGNLARLSAAVAELEADVYSTEGRFRFNHDAESFLGTSVRNLICDIGRFDLTFTPTDMGTYDDMLPDAVELLVPVEGQPKAQERVSVLFRASGKSGNQQARMAFGHYKEEAEAILPAGQKFKILSMKETLLKRGANTVKKITYDVEFLD